MTTQEFWALDLTNGNKLVIIAVSKFADDTDYVSVLGYREGNWPLEDFKIVKRIARPKV